MPDPKFSILSDLKALNSVRQMLWEFYWMQKQTLPRRTRRGLNKKPRNSQKHVWTNCDFWPIIFSKIAFQKRLLKLVPLSDELLQNWHFSSWFQFLHSWKWGHFHLWMLYPGSHFSLLILFFPKITPTKRQQNDRQNLDGFPETPRQSICEVVYIHLSNPTNNPNKKLQPGGWGIRFQQTICSRLVKQLWIWRRVAPWKKSWNSRQQARVGRCPTHVQRWVVGL